MQDDPQGYLDMAGKAVEELKKPSGSHGDNNGPNIDTVLELSDLTGLHADDQHNSTPNDTAPSPGDDVIRIHVEDLTGQGSGSKDCADDATNGSNGFRTRADDVTAQNDDIRTTTKSPEVHREEQDSCNGVKSSSSLSDEVSRVQDSVNGRSQSDVVPSYAPAYIELGVARTEQAPEPLQPRWSRQDTQTTTNQPSSHEGHSAVWDNTVQSLPVGHSAGHSSGHSSADTQESSHKDPEPPEGPSIKDSTAGAKCEVTPTPSKNPSSVEVNLDSRNSESQSSDTVAQNIDPSLDVLKAGETSSRRESVVGDTAFSPDSEDHMNGSRHSLSSEHPTEASTVPYSETFNSSDSLNGQSTSGEAGSNVALVACDADDVVDQSRKSFAENVCCCCRAVQGAFLRCQEETPAMVTGVVLSILFCVTIIVVIPTTRQVRSVHCLSNPISRPMFPYACQRFPSCVSS